MRLGVLAPVLLLGLCVVAGAQDVPMQDVSFSEGFEDGEDPFVFWVANGDYEVHWKGVTDERAFEGDRSFKLDVTLNSGSYWYWRIPIDFPAEGDLRFSGRILVTEGHDVRSGLGMQWRFPPTRHTGCGGFAWQQGTGEEWMLIEGDIDEVSASKAESLMQKYAVGATGDNVGAYVDIVGLFLEGRPGARMVVYVDDLRVTGSVPEAEAYEREIAERWSEFAQRWAGRIAAWRDRLETSTAALNELANLPAEVADVREDALGTVNEARATVDQFAEIGYARQTEVDMLEGLVRVADLAPATVSQIAEAARRGEKVGTFVVPAISNTRILPTAPVVPGESAAPVEISACRGEYESASFVALPLIDLEDVIVQASPLRGDAGTISADRVDLKLVKCWYQAGRGIRDLDDRLLVPELLLNDPDLVRVEHEEQHNYLRSTAEDGTETYLLCSGETSENLEGARPIEAQTLQPVDLQKLRLQQYWVTVHVPEDAAAGEYEGSLVLQSADTADVEVPVRLTVHDFDLAGSPLIYAIYYNGKLWEEDQWTIDSRRTSEEQYRAQIVDMKAHGVLYPTVYQDYTEDRLPRALEIRAELGMPTEHLFGEGAMTGSPQTPEALDRLREKVRKWVAMGERFGYENVYFYGIDEARGERLAAQRAAWQAVHEEGGKIFVACYYGTFEAMGDLLDVAVLAGKPDPEEAAKFHSVGNMAFMYAYPQVGPEEPETFRRNFGLLLWQAGYDGAMDYAYQRDFGHVWNDFDSDRYRDECFTYPTVHGIVGTVQWEGFREAVDDTRYMATLQSAIEASDDADAKAAAQAWIADLDPQRDLYEVRAEMVKHIRTLLGVR